MRMIDADVLMEYMCENCDGEACDGLKKDGDAKCYSIRMVEEQPTIKICSASSSCPNYVEEE